MTMRLHNLKRIPGSRHRRKNVGRGESSGRGKTSGRGGKGQSARSGSSMRPGFEGGQMPLIRRVPKRGFNNARFKTTWHPVNLRDLNQFADGTRVDEKLLREKRLATGNYDGIKLLGDGKLERRLSVVVHAASASARKAVEDLGGVCEVLPRFKRLNKKRVSPDSKPAEAAPAAPEAPKA